MIASAIRATDRGGTPTSSRAGPIANRFSAPGTVGIRLTGCQIRAGDQGLVRKELNYSDGTTNVSDQEEI